MMRGKVKWNILYLMPSALRVYIEEARRVNGFTFFSPSVNNAFPWLRVYCAF